MPLVNWCPIKNTERSAVSRWRGIRWELTPDVTPAVVNGKFCVMINPVDHPEESRWIGKTQLLPDEKEELDTV